MSARSSEKLSLIGGGILLLILLAVGGQSLVSFLANHSYYQSMLKTPENWGILFSALVIAFCVVLYLFKANKFTLKKRLILIAGGLSLFGLLHSLIKGGVVGIGGIITIFHTAMLLLIGAYTLTGIFALGSLIEQKFLKFSQHRRQELLFTFGIGLCSFLALIQLAVGLNIFYTPVARILFIGLGVTIYLEKKTIAEYAETLTTLFKQMQSTLKRDKKQSIALGILLTISFIYLCFGFQNSFIPYSTARDANHAYMYEPKIIAQNGGIYRGNTVMSFMPGIRHMFITFFFSLTQTTG